MDVGELKSLLSKFQDDQVVIFEHRGEEANVSYSIDEVDTRNRVVILACVE